MFENSENLLSLNSGARRGFGCLWSDWTNFHVSFVGLS